MTLTQDDFERHIQAMWPVTRAEIEIDFSIAAILGYPYAMACINTEWHQDCIFLVGILREKERLA